MESSETQVSTTVHQSIHATDTLPLPQIITPNHESEFSGRFTPTEPKSGVAVIIPTHNNELTIGTLVLLSKVYAPNVIVVDTGSLDRTVEVAKRAGADVISLTGPCTRVKALMTGCRRAIGYDCKAVVLLDSNGEHLTRFIPSLVRPVLEGTDLVIGSRNLHGRRGIDPYNPDIMGKSSDLPVNTRLFRNTDPESTFRAISVRGICLLDALPFSDNFEPLMISLFQHKGLSLEEIAISVRHEIPMADDDLPRYRGKKVAVVVPAHNEQLLIGETLSGIPDFIARIYVVNDYSSDRTQEIVEYYAREDRSIVPIIHEVNKGVGAAIVTGYKRALLDNMDIVAVMAGDNQMDPAFLPHLLDPIVDGKCDYTMGNRLASPEYRKSMSRWRLTGNAILTMLTKIASGYWSMMDPQNGYTAISTRALERMNLDDIYPRYGYCNDLLVKLNANTFRVINVPHPARYGRETSGIRYHTYIVSVSNLLLMDFLWRLKTKYIMLSFHPLVLFYLAGVTFTLVGISGGIYSLYYKFILGNAIFVPLVLSILVLGFGIGCICFAMFFDMAAEKGTNGWYS